MQLSHGDVIEILRIVDSCGIGELRLEIGDLRLHVVKGGVTGNGDLGAPTAHPVSANTEAKRGLAQTRTVASTVDASPVAAGTNLVAVTSPMVGTFYRAPAPDAPPFVNVGQRVKADTPVGIVEVMKLMNTVDAGVAGIVREVRAADAQMVEYGEVLVLIEPEEGADA